MMSSALRSLRACCLLVATLASMAAPAHAGDDAAASASAQPIARWQPRLGRVRPLVVVVGENAGTELVDFMIPYGILAESGVADVRALATAAGPLQLRPALRIQAPQTIDEFDVADPLGADYVVVPAFTDEGLKDAALLAWLRAQSGKGATVVSICDGALAVANAGLFDGHRATGHWATDERRRAEHPAARWVSDVRYVADGNVVSSAGVSAAIPTALALVEAMGGTQAADETAARLGASDWSDAHDSRQFHIGADSVLTYVGNRWLRGKEAFDVPMSEGLDDIALALVVDAWGRTMRSRLVPSTADGAPVRSRHGLVLLPAQPAGERSLSALPIPAGAPLGALDGALAEIGRRYGPWSKRYVALEMEYAPGYAQR